jgi:type IV pilus modification protein PilV
MTVHNGKSGRSASLNSNGFTLIEVLVAMGILSIAILGLAVGATSVIKGNQSSYATAIAVNLAQDKLEELKARPASLASGGPVTDTYDGQTYSRSWTVTNNSPISGMKRIDVTVTWTDYQTKTVTLSSAVKG